MMKTSARVLIAAATIALAIGVAAAPIVAAPVQVAEHAQAHSTPARAANHAKTPSAPVQTAETRARFAPDQTKTGCHKYTPDSPQYLDCMAQ